MIAATNLRTEYLTDPLGIDITEPRVDWNVEGAVKQSAYELRVTVNGNPTEYPKVLTDQMHAKLCGLNLKSRDRVEWQVRLYDEQGQPGEWSGKALFEMGLLNPGDWKAKWIMGDYKHSPKKKVRYPADCFRKTFAIKRSVAKARLYITACGMYEAHLNGSRVGDMVLAPGSTGFHKRVHYQVYDVTALVQERNELRIDLADGFYAGSTGCYGHTKTYGYEPKVLAQLELVEADGKIHMVKTDHSFAWSNDGPVRYADMKQGEDIDFCKKPSYLGNARETDYPGIVCCSNSVKILEKETFQNPKVLHTPNGQTVLDFGQNMAGYVSCRVRGEVGHSCRMVLGEKLDAAGNFTTRNISLKGDYTEDRLQTVCLTCNGVRQEYKTRFSVMGFQYVLLLDWPEAVKAENFTAYAVYSDMKETGHFECSDAGINQIVHNTLWSMKGNFLDVPTDCPTRERAGWTGDAQLFFNTGNYLMEQRAFFRKWLRDVEDNQKANGMIYNKNPSMQDNPGIVEWFCVEGSVGWGDAFLLIPYYYWKRYGDDAMIREHWPAMKRAFAYYEKRIGKRNLFSVFSPRHDEYGKYLCACGRDFGEWTEPADCAPSMLKLAFPHTEEGTAYIANDARIMSEMAAHMGEEKEALRLAGLHGKLKEAYNRYFVGDGSFETDRMCKYVRPCGLDMAEGRPRQRLLEQIVRLNRVREYRVGTGFLSTPFLLEALSEAGASDDAYRVLANPVFGWMQQVNQGATTIWENWTDDASLNHYAKGSCCQWLFDCLSGIRLDGEENHFVIAPHVVSQLEYLNFTYDSAYGPVSSNWKRKGKEYQFDIVIPSNCSAEAVLPNGERMQLTTGSFTFRVEM